MFASVNAVHTHDLHLPASLLARNQLHPSFLSLCPPQRIQLRLLVNASLHGMDQRCGTGSSCQSMGFAQATVNPGGCPTNSFRPGFSGNILCSLRQFRLRLRFWRTVSCALCCPTRSSGGISNNFGHLRRRQVQCFPGEPPEAHWQRMDLPSGLHALEDPVEHGQRFSTFNFKGLNQLNPNAEWSIGNDDRTHVLNIVSLLRTPIGPGKKLLNRGGPGDERTWLEVGSSAESIPITRVRRCR